MEFPRQENWSGLPFSSLGDLADSGIETISPASHVNSLPLGTPLGKPEQTICMCAQSCLILWDPRNCSPPGSSLHGIFQAIILEWVATSYSRGPSFTSNQTCISCTSCIGREILYHLHHLGNPYYSTIISKIENKEKQVAISFYMHTHTYTCSLKDY